MSDYKVDKYKFNEDVVLNKLRNHILGTYDQHYSTDKIQATEFIIDSGMGEGFCMGNIIKYATRHKNKNGAEDIKKIIHYCELLLELEYGKESKKEEPRKSVESKHPEGHYASKPMYFPDGYAKSNN